MGYKNPHDERRIDKDFAYMNSERGYITRTITAKFKPSYKKYGGHTPKIDKKEFWRLYMNHIINMKEKFPGTDGRICRYCEQPFTFKARRGTRGKGYQGRQGQIKTNFSIDRYDPRLTYMTDNIVFCCVSCNDKKRDSNPSDWLNYLRVGLEFKRD
jgi:hypothetical protein